VKQWKPEVFPNLDEGSPSLFSNSVSGITRWSNQHLTPICGLANRVPKQRPLLISTAHGTGQNGGREFGFGYSTKGFHQSSPVCGLLLKYCCADEI